MVVPPQYEAGLVAVCQRGSCLLDCSGLDAVTILDCDKVDELLNSGRKRCDFLVWAGGDLAAGAAVEMKSASWKAEDVQGQLQAGADLLDKLAGQFEVRSFLPLLLYKAISHRAQITSLLNKKVTFPKAAYKIVPYRCGTKLADLLRPQGVP